MYFLESAAKDAQPAPSRKGRIRYGDFFAADFDHFGHFPTRRAVISRDSRPYVHLACGKGFSHPMDVKDHHLHIGGGKGCNGKDGVPQSDKDTWDAHPSARIGYPELNYTKVKDGYILLDKESRDKLNNAIAAGLEYLKEQEERGGKRDSGVGSSDEDEGGEVEGEMEIEIEKEDTEMHEPAAKEASARVSEFGLRKRSTRVTYGEV